MEHNKMDIEQRRINVIVSLPVDIWTAISIYSNITGVIRSKVIERAILFYLAYQHNNAVKKKKLNDSFTKAVES